MSINWILVNSYDNIVCHEKEWGSTLGTDIEQSPRCNVWWKCKVKNSGYDTTHMKKKKEGKNIWMSLLLPLNFGTVRIYYMWEKHKCEYSKYKNVNHNFYYSKQTKQSVPSITQPTMCMLFSQPKLCFPCLLAFLMSTCVLSIAVGISSMWVLSTCDVSSPNWDVPLCIKYTQEEDSLWNRM